MEDAEFDVIIVGAGISGLVAARHLVKNQKKVCILEARNRVGGRILSRKTPSGKTVDLGAQWVGDGQTHLQSLLNEFSIKIFPDKAKGNHLLFLDNKLSSFNNSIPKLSFFPLLDFYLNLYRVETNCVEVSQDVPVATKYAKEWDEMTVESWAHSHIHTKSVRKLFTLFTEAVYAAGPRDMSFLFFLSTLHHSCGPIYGVEGASACSVEGGLSQMCERIAAELNGSIRLNSAVKKISQLRESVTVQTMTHSYSAKKVIVAVPPVLASQISFTPSLPPKRDKLLQKMPMGSAIKTFAIYKKPFWREKGFSGKVVNDTGLVRLIYDASPHDDSYGVLLAFLLGKSVIHIEKTSETWLADSVLSTLAKFFGEEARKPEEFIFYNWNEDPWARGGYAGYMPPGVMTTVGDTLQDPSGHIYWAGTETSVKWNGYIEGAIQSGLRAANQILEQQIGYPHE